MEVGTTTSTRCQWEWEETILSDDGNIPGLTLILTIPNEEKELFHLTLLILFYYSMKTSPLHEGQIK